MSKIRGIVYILFSCLFLVFSCGEKKNVADAIGAPGGSKQIASVEGFILQPRPLANAIRTSGSIQAFEEVELHPEATGRIVKILFKEGSAVNKGALLVKINDEDLQAQLRKITSQTKLSKEQLGRQEELLKINATSKQEFDISTNQISTLEADEDIIRAAISKTESERLLKE